MKKIKNPGYVRKGTKGLKLVPIGGVEKKITVGTVMQEVYRLQNELKHRELLIKGLSENLEVARSVRDHNQRIAQSRGAEMLELRSTYSKVLDPLALVILKLSRQVLNYKRNSRMWFCLFVATMITLIFVAFQVH
jgi:hypothetical protein